LISYAEEITRRAFEIKVLSEIVEAKKRNEEIEKMKKIISKRAPLFVLLT
jgi:GMP synthase-like glutamine amidotransferase